MQDVSELGNHGIVLCHFSIAQPHHTVPHSWQRVQKLYGVGLFAFWEILITFVSPVLNYEGFSAKYCKIFTGNEPRLELYFIFEIPTGHFRTTGPPRAFLWHYC